MVHKTKKVGAAVMLLTFTACTSLQPVADSQAFFAKESPRFVVVTTTDQDQTEDPLVLTGPRLESGTITGMYQGEQTSVPVTRVKTLQANQRDSRKTTWAIVIGGAIAGTVGYLISTSGDGKSSTFECNPDEVAGRCY
jgi:hypothetical protein